MELIKIEERNGMNTVNARELWEGLESKRQFGNWMQDRLPEFIEGVDFIINKTVRVQTEGIRQVERPIIEYYLSIDAAKHIAMLERNEIGKRFRQYFIDVENRARKISPAPTGKELLALALIEAHKTLDELKPKAELADRMLNTDNLRTISDVGKILGKPKKIFTDMIEQNILFRSTSHGKILPYQKYIDEGLFIVRYTLVKINENEKRIPQTYVTAKGEEFIVNKIYAPKLGM